MLSAINAAYFMDSTEEIADLKVEIARKNHLSSGSPEMDTGVVVWGREFNITIST